MRISYHPPPDQEGATALHVAVQSGRTELVRYLLDKGANPELVDANGKKPIDLIVAAGDGAGRGRGGAPAAADAGAGRGAGGRGGAGGGGVNPAATAEIRSMLQAAASKK
jgi:hypothetical protein